MVKCIDFNKMMMSGTVMITHDQNINQKGIKLKLINHTTKVTYAMGAHGPHQPTALYSDSASQKSSYS